MEAQLRRILGEAGGLTVPVDRIEVDDDLFAAGLTSLATVSLLITIEDEFGVAVPDALLKRETFRTMTALMAVIEQLGGSVHA